MQTDIHFDKCLDELKEIIVDITAPLEKHLNQESIVKRTIQSFLQFRKHTGEIEPNDVNKEKNIRHVLEIIRCRIIRNLNLESRTAWRQFIEYQEQSYNKNNRNKMSRETIINADITSLERQQQQPSEIVAEEA